MNIVLSHGILGFNTIPILNVEYFNGVKAHLENKFNAKVFVSKVGAISSIETRGNQLQEQINLALGKITGVAPILDPNKKVHIIAHSMGGLDSRYILSKNNDRFVESVSTLTTIGTPHQGSPVADLCYSLVDGKNSTPFIDILVDGFENSARIALERLNIINGLEDLTTSKMQAFNDKYPDNNDVQYFCVGGKGRDSVAKTCLALLPTHAYIASKSDDGEPNDGMVSISSAYRNGWEKIGEPWPFDHFQEVGHNLDDEWKVFIHQGFHLSYYENIVERIQSVEN